MPGIAWSKPRLGIYVYNGSTANNILLEDSGVYTFLGDDGAEKRFGYLFKAEFPGLELVTCAKKRDINDPTARSVVVKDGDAKATPSRPECCCNGDSGNRNNRSRSARRATSSCTAILRAPWTPNETDPQQ